MLESHLGNRFGNALGFVLIQRIRLTLVHGTITAATRTDLPQNHERRHTVGPTLTHIGAHRLLADRVESQASQQCLELMHVSTKRRPDF